jgi:hypothetical protein
MNPSILHLSDLHRDPKNPVTNTVLLDSILRDRDRYAKLDPYIPEPNLIIVSGDLVYGVRKDEQDAEGELNRQYDEAETFLVKLADEFVNGDHERVITIPGNHDVSFPLTFKSFEKIASEDTSKHVEQYFTESLSKDLRWSWSDLAFFKIKDHELYKRRLESFSKFYEKFYQGKRSYSLDPAKQFDIFDYPDLNLTVAALSSCYNNDPINRAGMIHPDSISHANATIRALQNPGRLRLAVWHHDTHGVPNRDDYLDPNTLQVLIDSGFSLGFHGHQHKAQFVNQQFEYGDERQMIIFSAGTLCAGPKELPSGRPRSYNVIEINLETVKGRLHIRAMSNDNFNIPVWATHTLAGSGKSCIEFSVPNHKPNDKSSEQASRISEAESLLQSKKPNDAIDLLKPLVQLNSAAHVLYTDALHDAERWALLCQHLDLPQTIREIIYKYDALEELNDRAGIRRWLELPIVIESTDPSVIELREKAKRVHV